MSRTFGPVQRFVALSVAMTLLTSTVASAQSTNSTAPAASSAPAPLLSSSAFARLAHVLRPDVAPPAAKAAPRGGLLRAAEAEAREIPAPKAPRRAKGNMIGLAVVLGLVGFLVLGIVWASLD